MAVGALSRAEFRQAAQLFIHKQNTSQPGNEFITRSLWGWSWREHSSVPSLGYMTRSGSAFRTNPAISSIVPDTGLTDEINEVDDSTLPHHAHSQELLTVEQYIVYAPSFQVPAFYFTVHDNNGSPLSLQAISQTSLFHPRVLPKSVNTASHTISTPASNFPLLSQGDHPVLGTPSWYFHPCETSAAVAELLQEADLARETEDEALLRWMEMWFLVLSGIVDLR